MPGTIRPVSSHTGTCSKSPARTAGYAEHAIPRLEQIGEPEAIGYALQLKHYLGLTRQVIDQTERRVFKEEKVPAAEKVVSIFEPHTDIIVKDRRENPLRAQGLLVRGRVPIDHRLRDHLG